MRNILKIELNPERIYGLDILRAFAILFVVAGHGEVLLPRQLKSINDFFVFDGVSIFFVLSGFLIGGILIKILEKNQITINLLFEFLIRRWFRTLPNYFLILITLGILHFFLTDHFSFWSIKSYFIFSQNLFSEHPSWFFPEAWSLSIEEWFYLLVPIIIFSLIKIIKFSTRKAVLFTAVLMIILVTCFRFMRYNFVHVENITEWDSLYRKQVFTRLDSLMYGVIGAYFNFHHISNWLKHKNIFFILGIILLISSKIIIPNLFFVGGIYSCVFSFSVISLGTLFLLPFLNDFKKGKSVFYKIITYISLVSYSMYLLNLSIVREWIINKINWNDILSNGYLIIIIKYSLYWFLTIVLSILLYKYFEIPLTKLRDYKRIIKTNKTGI